MGATRRFLHCGGRRLLLGREHDQWAPLWASRVHARARRGRRDCWRLVVRRVKRPTRWRHNSIIWPLLDNSSPRALVISPPPRSVGLEAQWGLLQTRDLRRDHRPWRGRRQLCRRRRLWRWNWFCNISHLRIPKQFI